MNTNDSIRARLAAVRRRIAAAEAAHGRAPGSVRLLVASKAHAAAAVAAAADAGQRDFGESYLQEAQSKIEALRGRGLCWHFIGAIQGNKTRAIAAHFDWVHGVARLSVARRLSDWRPAHLGDLHVCVQVNVDAEPRKAGVAPHEAAPLAVQIAALPRLRLRGLMAIPKPLAEISRQRRAFAKLRALFENVAARCGGGDFDVLSIGMSGDFEAAIAEGATIVRIGSAVMGPRPPA